MMSQFTPEGSFLSQDDNLNESLENLIPHAPHNNSQLVQIVRNRLWCRMLPWVVNGLVFFLSLSILLYSIIRFQTDVRCGIQLSTFCKCLSIEIATKLGHSPAESFILAPSLEAIEYQSVVFNGTETYPSIYRGDPSDEIDNAWSRVSKDRMQLPIATIRTSCPDCLMLNISSTHSNRRGHAL